MSEIVIAGAARTAVGAFNGGLSSVPASYLATVAIEEALKRAKTEPGEVDEVVMGQILAAGGGQNPARQAAVNAGIPVEKTAYAINQLCGSGLRTVALGYQSIKVGDAGVVVAGGMESMSQAPHVMHLRNGVKMGDAQMIDTMIKDGLWDAFNGYHMGTTAENVAQQWQITRDEQDAFAAASQQKAEAAQNAGKFKDEIVPVTIKGRKGDTIVDTDEHPKHGTTVESLAKLRPAFDPERRHRHCGERLRHQRRRCSVGPDDRRRRRQARHHPARPNRFLGDPRRRSLDHGHRADPGQSRRAGEGRLVDRRSGPGGSQ